MKKYITLFFLTFLVFAGGLTGCVRQSESGNAGQVIEQSRQLPSVEEQVQYLIKAADDFMNSGKFEDALTTARHILNDLDQNSLEAERIFEKAQAEITKLAGKKIDQAAGQGQSVLGGLGR